jgi:hypothetical protein
MLSRWSSLRWWSMLAGPIGARLDEVYDHGGLWPLLRVTSFCFLGGMSRTRFSIRHAAVVSGVAAAGAYATIQWLGRTSGSLRSERRERLPGDELVDRPHFVTDHAVTIDATPEEVWPWLVQMGWHRGGWYTSRWVDVLLFPANQPAAESIHAEWQALAVGDAVPDGPPESHCYFVVRELEPLRHLVLQSTSHLPPEFRDRFGAWLSWSWVFVLRELEGGRTRFHFRSRGRLGPPWLSAAYSLVLVPADHVMGRQMLNGVKRRAERLSSPPLLGR